MSRLHLGCGVTTPSGWFDGIYASHLLEHLNLEEGKRLLRECFRVLQANGVPRMVVPDLEAIVREYLGEKPFGELSGEMEMLPPADRLNRRLLLRSPEPSSGGSYSEHILP